MEMDTKASKFGSKQYITFQWDLKISFPIWKDQILTPHKRKRLSKEILLNSPSLRSCFYIQLISNLSLLIYSQETRSFCQFNCAAIILHVGKGILSPLKKLITADFLRNICIEMKASTRSEIFSLVTVLETSCRNDTIDELNRNPNQQLTTSACEPLRSPIACIDELKRKLDSKENCYQLEKIHCKINLFPPNLKNLSLILLILLFSIAVSCPRSKRWIEKDFGWNFIFFTRSVL